MVKVIDLEEGVVKKLREADIQQAGLSSFLEQMVEKHAKDPDPSFINSPVFQGLWQQHLEAKALFENLKAGIEPDYVPAVSGHVPDSWDLDYSSGKLSVVYRPK